MVGLKEDGMKRFFTTYVVALLAMGLAAQANKSTAKKPEAKQEAKMPKIVTTPSGLKYQDLVEGTGESPKDGDTVVVHYTGWLLSLRKFDSSVDRGQPLPFHLGKGEVIKGWDEGIAGMKVGGKRQLRIPPELAYGEAGHPPQIPQNATLIFDVQLVAIK